MKFDDRMEGIREGDVCPGEESNMKFDDRMEGIRDLIHA
jgi:hypothetical protein